MRCLSWPPPTSLDWPGLGLQASNVVVMFIMIVFIRCLCCCCCCCLLLSLLYYRAKVPFFKTPSFNWGCLCFDCRIIMRSDDDDGCCCCCRCLCCRWLSIFLPPGGHAGVQSWTEAAAAKVPVCAPSSIWIPSFESLLLPMLLLYIYRVDFWSNGTTALVLGCCFSFLYILQYFRILKCKCFLAESKGPPPPGRCLRLPITCRLFFC